MLTFHMSASSVTTTMLRRRKESIARESDLVDVQLRLLRSQEADYQILLDDIFARKHAVSTQRKELEARRRELDRQRHPIHWLPPELLIHIFLAVVHDDSPTVAPFHRAPVVLSHVCSRWRSLTLGVSRLWSRILLQSEAGSGAATVEFLRRSLAAPLDITFALPGPLVNDDMEFQRAEQLFGYLDPHFSRIRSLSVQTRAMVMSKLVLSLRLKDLSNLQSLDLTALTLAQLPNLSTPYTVLNPSQPETSASKPPLRHLRLDRLPLYNIPTPFLVNLVTLELNFPPKKLTAEQPSSYMLRLSHLLRFLRETPKLEELVLTNTVPYVDVARNDEEHAPLLPILPRVNSIELVHLRSIDWAYPFASDVHYFLSFLVLPVLESIDIGVQEFTSYRPHVHLFRGYTESGASQLWNRIHQLPALRSVSIQCVNTDGLSTVLRKFTMPNLTSLDLAFDPDAPLVALPRLEALLREPRLPFLTTLSISHFIVPQENVSMLGYIPALQSLSMVACIGAPLILRGLVVGRACPQLTELRLELCDDVQPKEVMDLVLAHNAGLNAAPGRRAGPFISSKRPMKKLPRSAHLESSAVEGEDVTSRMLSLTLQQRTSGLSRIRSVCVDNCAKIEETVVGKLQQLGVERVVWVG
ncbi:hypothetical protein MIND_00590400 [Mycena indigotica]|uniref:F-box domain-containing protein n=1 Tax=Mycena indigotica TaxID=2126181 RepID=A0A8H6SRY4_9AGAR|nr:uncharacterized protein MIND_00590400 [Mycena indigotica]KAF7303611.1 hypothetical protein MIND_00590400 [Mycena indigotica]